MKALFLIFHGFNDANGISKKIQYQVQALKDNGLETHLCYLCEDNGSKQRIIDTEVIADYGNGIKGKIYKRLEYRSLTHYILEHRFDFIYMRSNHNANPFTIRMLKRLKQEEIKIVMEIPTYPYDQEYVTLFMKIELLIDRCFRKKMARYLDSIVTFSEYKKIFGTPTIQISNGIDFRAIPQKCHMNETTYELHLLGVAEIHYWHGYDRLIQGLAEYYATNPSYKVYFHLAGKLSGQREHDEIIPLIQKYHLEPYVILHGALYGEALDDLFEHCDLGIGSLGRHRSGITNIKTLKNREYTARGIPFIYSEIDSDFENMPYILKVPANDSPIEIGTIISFYKAAPKSPAEIRNSISHLSWKEQMQKVLRKVL